MPAAGDDLRKHLLVPSACSLPFHPPSPAARPHDPDPRPDTPRLHKSVDRKAEINMEVDYPPSSTLLPTQTGDAALTIPIDNVMSLDDFLSASQEDHDAFMAAREAANVPPSKKAKVKSSTPVQPVAVGARSSKHTILLHEMYQALAIPQPVFTYQGDSVTKFSVEISFPGLANAEELQGLKQEGRFNSKQEAKEAMSKSAFIILERLVSEGRIIKAGKSKKPKGEPTPQSPGEREDAGENFVGQLLEFQRATGGPQPTYTDYALGPRWSCLASIEGHPTAFGSVDALFGTKKLARQHAAGCAVAYFKDLGTWPTKSTPLGGIKKRKPASPSASSSPGPHASTPSAATPASATAQVASLAHTLGLSTPEYLFEPSDPGAPDMHSVAVFFKDGGKHAGPIGGVRHIFGKKNAKAECARRALVYLEEVKKERMELADRLVRGIRGGVVEGKGEMEVDDLDELDIYVDAMER